MSWNLGTKVALRRVVWNRRSASAHRQKENIMFVTYLVVAVTYVFSACAGWALIAAVDHLDPKEDPRVEQPAPRELKLAS